MTNPKRFVKKYPIIKLGRKNDLFIIEKGSEKRYANGMFMIISFHHERGERRKPIVIIIEDLSLLFIFIIKFI